MISKSFLIIKNIVSQKIMDKTHKLNDSLYNWMIEKTIQSEGSILWSRDGVSRDSIGLSSFKRSLQNEINIHELEIKCKSLCEANDSGKC